MDFLRGTQICPRVLIFGLGSFEIDMKAHFPPVGPRLSFGTVTLVYLNNSLHEAHMPKTEPAEYEINNLSPLLIYHYLLTPTENVERHPVSTGIDNSSPQNVVSLARELH